MKLDKSKIKSKAALKFLEDIEEIDLNLETKYELVGAITYMAENSIITYEEYCELLDSLEMTTEELQKTNY